MASQGANSVASFLLIINLVMYAILSAIAGWALNYGINVTPHAASGLSVPARLFPIYYPIGNMTTGFFVIFALVSGVVGIATSVTGLQDVFQSNSASLLSAATSSLVTWGLTLLSLGLACKEISIGWRTASLRTMETLSIILSGTQLLCSGAIHAAASAAPVGHQTHFRGRA